MKKKLKKHFNGKFFIDYLKKNPPPSADAQLLSKLCFINEKDESVKITYTVDDLGICLSSASFFPSGFSDRHLQTNGGFLRETFVINSAISEHIAVSSTHIYTILKPPSLEFLGLTR